MTEEQKQLVVLAAKAMGYKVYGVVTDADDIEIAILVGFFGKKGKTAFNSLTSDSDNVQMCDELEINIDYLDNTIRASNDYGECYWADESYGSDKSTARRLASTRVAAEIQRRKESK